MKGAESESNDNASSHLNVNPFSGDTFRILNLIADDATAFAIFVAFELSIPLFLSVIIFNATDCTRPADLLPGNFLHKTGERLNPTKKSNALLAKYALTKFLSIFLGSFSDSKTACKRVVLFS